MGYEPVTEGVNATKIQGREIAIGSPEDGFDLKWDADIGKWVPQADATSGGGAWGTITGTLSTQTDLQAALDAKIEIAEIGTSVQAYDADLVDLAGIHYSANMLSLLGAADYAAMKTQLALTIGTNVQAYDADLTTWAGITPGTGVGTFLATPSSANLATAVTDETGSGALTFATSPTLTTPKITTGIKDSNSVNILTTTPTTSAVNYFDITNSITATGPILSVAGSDASISMNLNIKGTASLITNAQNFQMTNANANLYAKYYNLYPGGASASTYLDAPSDGRFRINNSSGTAIWNIGSTGILAGTDNTYDIGATGATRPRNVYVSGTIAAQGSGAASTPSLNVTGVPFAGTGTTSFPLVYINDSAATASTTLNTAGTYLGVNGDGTQDLMNLLKDGISMFKVSSAGASTVGPSIAFGTTANNSILKQTTSRQLDLYELSGTLLNRLLCRGIVSSSDGTNLLSGLDNNNPGLEMVSGSHIAWSSSGSNANNAADTGINKSTPGVVEFNNGTAGTLRDWTARNGTLSGTLSVTGASTLTGGAIAGAPVRLKGYTVATLPAGTQGDTAYCTDLLTPTYLVAAVGGGAVVGPVFYNGSGWVSF